MTTDGIARAVAEELAATDEEMEVVEVLLDDGHPRVAIARVYFALFHALRALLFSAGHEPRNHVDVRILFSRHFVQDGPFTAADARLFTRLHSYREDADYGLVRGAFDVAGTREELAGVRELIVRVREAIAT